MTRIGYKLSSEEFGPTDLVQQAVRAETAGFDFALISDHFHPWTDRQGQSPFVWAALGGIARATERLTVGTGVTCPTIRTHPAIVAHAAATVAAMMPGRFFLGVGTGENLNEHVTGAKWPPVDVRREMLEEAVAVMRLLWRGDVQSHRGSHYTVEAARLYTLPPKPPPIVVAAERREVGTPGGSDRGRLHHDRSRSSPAPHLPPGGRSGQAQLRRGDGLLGQERAGRPSNRSRGLGLGRSRGLAVHGDRAARALRGGVQADHEEQVASVVVCGPDPARHLAAIRQSQPRWLRPRLRAPDRARPGGLHPVL